MRAVAAWIGEPPCRRAAILLVARRHVGLPAGVAGAGGRTGRGGRPEGPRGSARRPVRTGRAGARLRHPAAEAGPGGPRPLAGVRRRVGVDEPGRGLARGRARRVRLRRGLPHRRAGGGATAGGARPVPRPPAARARGRRALRVVDRGGSGGRPRPARRLRGGARRGIPRGRGLERGRGPDRRCGVLPAGLGEGGPPPPPRGRGAAAGRPRRHVGAPGGAAHPRRHPRLRTSLRRLPREVRDAHPDVVRRRRPGRRRLVASGGGRQPVVGPPARPRREPRPSRRIGRPPTPLTPSRHGRLRDAYGTVRRGSETDRGGRGAHADGRREGDLGPLPRGAGVADAIPRRRVPRRAAQLPVRGTGLGGPLGGAGGARRQDAPRRPLPRAGARDVDPSVARRE